MWNERERKELAEGYVMTKEKISENLCVFARGGKIMQSREGHWKRFLLLFATPPSPPTSVVTRFISSLGSREIFMQLTECIVKREASRVDYL